MIATSAGTDRSMQDAPRVADSMRRMRLRFADELPQLKRRADRLCARYRFMKSKGRRSRRLYNAARDAIGDELACAAFLEFGDELASDIEQTGTVRPMARSEHESCERRVDAEFRRRAGPSAGGSS